MQLTSLLTDNTVHKKYRFFFSNFHNVKNNPLDQLGEIRIFK